jgi:hypothetical protein
MRKGLKKLDKQMILIIDGEEAIRCSLDVNKDIKSRTNKIQSLTGTKNLQKAAAEIQNRVDKSYKNKNHQEIEICMETLDTLIREKSIPQSPEYRKLLELEAKFSLTIREAGGPEPEA